MRRTLSAASLARICSLGVALAAVAPSVASATPSTTYWAPTVAACQGKYTPHVTYDTYYGRGTPPPGAGAPAYPIDTGLTMGLLPTSKLQAEGGYDMLLPSTDPLFVFLNFKACTPESSLFKGSPSLGGGIYNWGFKKDITDYNVLYFVGQKTLPFGGYVSAGIYHGTNDVLFTNSDGNLAKTGGLFGWSSPDIPIGLAGLQKILVIADVQTGKNVLGGGGIGASLYFNDYIGLIVGPVWYTDSKLQPGGSSHLWTTQIDVDIPLGKAAPKAAALKRMIRP